MNTTTSEGLAKLRGPAGLMHYLEERGIKVAIDNRDYTYFPKQGEGFSQGKGYCLDDNTRFTYTWIEGCLLVSVGRERPDLIQAWSAVVGIRPICRYLDRDSKLLTFVWDSNPDAFFAGLKKDPVEELKILN